MSKMTWHALRTISGKEFKAAEVARLLGGKTIVPFEIQYRRSLGKQNKAVVREVKTALITGYAFCGFKNTPWERLLDEEAIIGKVMLDGQPAKLTGADLDILYSMYKDPIRLSRHNKSFKVGDQVKVTSGPWVDKTSILHEIMNDAAMIEVELCGKSHRVPVPVGTVERVG